MKQQCNVVDLPTDAVQYIVELRREAAKFRLERNAARAETRAAAATISCLETELAALKAPAAK